MTKKERRLPLGPSSPLKPHCRRPWLPEIAGHGQSRKRSTHRPSRSTLEQLEERTRVLQEEIFSSQADNQSVEEPGSIENKPSEETNTE